jgi:hypothetical protein
LGLHEILGLAVREEDPASPAQKKDGEACGRGKRIGDGARARKQAMDRGRAGQMRRKGFEQVPFGRLHLNRAGRSR